MPRDVRAAVFYAPNRPLVVETLHLDDPGPDEILIKVVAAGLCHSDLHKIDGLHPQPAPAVLGHESTGIVLECGAAVSHVAPGDHVIPFLVPECGVCANCVSGKTNMCLKFSQMVGGGFTRLSKNGEPVHAFAGLGAFADHMVVKMERVAKINPAARPEGACYASCGGATGIGTVRHARVDAGSSVIVFGLGGIGLNVVQGARQAGAGIIIGVDTNPAKAEIARRYGVTHYIDPTGVDSILPQIQAITGMGAHFAFECVGAPALMRLAVEATNPFFGKTAIIGIAPDGAQLSVPTNALSLGRTVGGVLMGGMRARSDIPALIEDYVRGEFDFDAAISHRLTLDQINEGFAMMKRGESTRAVILF